MPSADIVVGRHHAWRHAGRCRRPLGSPARRSWAPAAHPLRAHNPPSGRTHRSDMARNSKAGPKRPGRKPTPTDSKGRVRRGRPKVCQFCGAHSQWVDYKDINVLRRYMNDRGRIRARGATGTCSQHQRDVAVAIKTARELALLPYTVRTLAPGAGEPTRRPPPEALPPTPGATLCWGRRAASIWRRPRSARPRRGQWSPTSSGRHRSI
jgi:small subunit ribosomal protein S18